MKIRILSLLCAAVLQVVPLARVVYTTAQAIVPESTVIFRLVIGAVAALGAFDAVSGASTIITSPNNATGTVGQVFTYRITVGPRSANIFRAAPLPSPGARRAAPARTRDGRSPALRGWTSGPVPCRG